MRGLRFDISSSIAWAFAVGGYFFHRLSAAIPPPLGRPSFRRASWGYQGPDHPQHNSIPGDFWILSALISWSIQFAPCNQKLSHSAVSGTKACRTACGDWTESAGRHSDLLLRLAASNSRKLAFSSLDLAICACDWSELLLLYMLSISCSSSSLYRVGVKAC